MATSLRTPRPAVLLLLSLLCLPALACGSHDDDGGSGGTSTSGGGVAASGGGIIGGSTSDGSTSDGSTAGGTGDTGDGGSTGGSGDAGGGSDTGAGGDVGGGHNGGGKVPTSPLRIPAINYKGLPFDAVTDFGKQTWESIRNDVRTACKDGTVCLKLERLYSVDLPASETATVSECGFVKISPAAGREIDRGAPLTIIGLGPCLGGTPGEGSPPETPPPDSPTPESPSPDGAPPDDSVSVSPPSIAPAP